MTVNAYTLEGKGATLTVSEGEGVYVDKVGAVNDSSNYDHPLSMNVTILGNTYQAVEVSINAVSGPYVTTAGAYLPAGYTYTLSATDLQSPWAEIRRVL